MNVRCQKKNKYLSTLIGFLMFALQASSQSSIAISSYDTALTLRYLSPHAADVYRSFRSDTSSAGILFLQNINLEKVKSLKIKVEQENLTVEILSKKDTSKIIFGREAVSQIVPILNEIHVNREIVLKTPSLSEYWIFIVVKLRGEFCVIKTSNKLFFGFENSVIDNLKYIFKVIGIDCATFVPKFSDG